MADQTLHLWRHQRLIDAGLNDGPDSHPSSEELGWKRLAQLKAEGLADFFLGNQERNYGTNPYQNGIAPHSAVEALLAAT